MSRLHLTLVQTSLHWQQPEANRAMLEEKLMALNGLTDLVLLPELFTTGFSMEARLAEAPGLHTTRWMQQMARRLDAAVAGSVMMRENGRVYNRLLWATPDAPVQHYDKIHLFGYGNEHEVFTPGTQRPLWPWRGWHICPQVCFDLRFPETSRNTLTPAGTPAYDLLLYVASWPQARRAAWQRLLPARAIENQCYVGAVNRVGADGHGTLHAGDSNAYDFEGNALLPSPAGEWMETLVLDKDRLSAFREKYRFLN